MNESITILDIGITFPFWRDTAILSKINSFACKLELYFHAKAANNLEEKQYVLTFEILQAYKVITIDSAKLKGEWSNFCEISDSEWIQCLKNNTSGDNNFYEKSRHFHIMFYDEVIDVIAWKYKCSEINM